MAAPRSAVLPLASQLSTPEPGPSRKVAVSRARTVPGRVMTSGSRKDSRSMKLAMSNMPPSTSRGRPGRARSVLFGQGQCPEPGEQLQGGIAQADGLAAMGTPTAQQQPAHQGHVFPPGQLGSAIRADGTQRPDQGKFVEPAMDAGRTETAHDQAEQKGERSEDLDQEGILGHGKPLRDLKKSWFCCMNNRTSRRIGFRRGRQAVPKEREYGPGTSLHPRYQ